MSTIFEAIKDDHDRLRTLMDRIADARPGERGGPFAEFRRELWAHAKVEETVFYAPLREREGTRMEILEGMNEHHLADALLDELSAMPTDGDAWTAKFTVLSETLRHHMEEEEDEVFDAADQVLNDQQAEAMGKSMEDRKRLVLEGLAPAGGG
jgi:hemerythrin superfamily protein